MRSLNKNTNMRESDKSECPVCGSNNVESVAGNAKSKGADGSMYPMYKCRSKAFVHGKEGDRNSTFLLKTK